MAGVHHGAPRTCKLHELDPARFNTVMTNLYYEQEKMGKWR